MNGDKLIRAAMTAVVVAVAGFAAVVSYSHIYGLGRAHGQDGAAAVVPGDVREAVAAAYAASLAAGAPLSQRAMAARFGISRRQVSQLITQPGGRMPAGAAAAA